MTKLYAKPRANTRGWVYCLAAITLFWLAPAVSMAQITTYSFSSNQGTFTPVPASSEQITSFIDDETANVSLGFPFRYNNVDYTDVSISNNGVAALGANHGYGFGQICDGIGQPVIGDIFDTVNSTYPTGGRAVIAALAMDLHTQSNTNISVFREGTTPNRKVTIEWGHERRYDAPNADDLSFQIVFYETSNFIDIIYGPMQLDASSPAVRPQVGLRGQSSSLDVLNVAAMGGGGFGSASRSSSLTDGIDVASASDLPTAGLTFHFAPIPPAPNDLGVVNFVAPRPDQTTCLLSAAEAVKVTIRNYGTQAQTSTPVHLIVNGVASAPFTATFSPALQPNSSVTYTIPQTVDMSTARTYTFKAYTSLSTEPAANHSNDSSNLSITLTGPVSPPTASLGTLGELTNARWQNARGATTPVGTSSNWTTGFPGSSETMVLPFRTGGGNLNSEWLLSPNYNIASANYFLIYKAAISKYQFSFDTISSMTDDTVKVVISTDCGNSWRTLRRFSQTELANGTITDELREFRSPLPIAPNGLRLAFVGTSNGTANTGLYYFHLDDVELKEVIPTDLGVTQVLAPVSGQPGCVLGTNEVVTVVVKNYGSATQTQSEVAYKLYNGSTFTAEASETLTFTPPLQPGNQDTVTISAAHGANLSVAGTYKVIAYTKLAGETANTRRNDTTKSNDITISSPFNLPSVTITGFGLSDPNGWGRGRGLTSPAGGASNWGYAFNNPAEYVGVTFTATATAPQREWWFSPSFAGTQYTTIIFKAGILAASSGNPAPNGMEDDTVSLKVSEDCGGSWRTVRKFSQADVTSGAISATLNEFTALVPSNGRVSFAFFANNNGTPSLVSYRFVVDDVQIKNSIPNDLGIVSSTAPVTLNGWCPQPAVSPSVTIRSYGSAPQSQATVSYSINGRTPVSQTFTLSPALAAGQATTVTFDAAHAAALDTAGTYHFVFFTTTPGDTSRDSRHNDTLSNITVVTRGAIPVTGTLTENYESTTGLVPDGWQAENYLTNRFINDFRVNADRGIDSSHAIGARMLPNNPYSWFVTPRYTLPSGSGNVVQFYLNMHEGLTPSKSTFLGPRDSLKVEVSTDCGVTWKRLGIVNFRNYTAPQPTAIFLYHSYSLDPYQGQEAVFRVQMWMTRTDGNGSLIDIDDWSVGAPVAVKSKIANLGYNLMPNPAREHVTVAGPPSGTAKVTVISSLGQQVSNKVMTHGNLDLSLNGLAPGMYRVIVTPEKGSMRQVLTLVKE